MVTVAYTGNKA